ncbi:E-selectin-like [Procambarus clarkii]|uniref:E-selectin-like n=1 Tax=Procambarus clarkii TaxID=6728 RepID=UPI0037430D10
MFMLSVGVSLGQYFGQGGESFTDQQNQRISLTRRNTVIAPNAFVRNLQIQNALPVQQGFPVQPRLQPLPFNQFNILQNVPIQPQVFQSPQVAFPPFSPQPPVVQPASPLPTQSPLNLCGHSSALIHATYKSRGYHLSWCRTQATFSWDQGNSYCSGLGRDFRLVSIESKDIDDFITDIIARHAVKFFWSGGNKRGYGVWRWLSGSLVTYSKWSHTGGNGQPQPDNREGHEDCLAVMNNFYNDGIKWHDIACYHDKPVICETSVLPSPYSNF